MDNRIFKNSYVIFVITFIMLCVIFYAFEIGYVTVTEKNKPEKRFSWKYPLAFSLITWIVWHFYVYPPPEEMVDYKIPEVAKQVLPKKSLIIPEKMLPKQNQMNIPRINMNNWN